MHGAPCLGSLRAGGACGRQLCMCRNSTRRKPVPLGWGHGGQPSPRQRRCVCRVCFPTLQRQARSWPTSTMSATGLGLKHEFAL